MTGPKRLHRDPEAGFSLIEGMIAALILLFVILGVLPLISQSMLNNLQGNDASTETNASVDGTERLLSLPFNSAEMTVPDLQPSRVLQDVFTLDSNRWIDKATFDLAPGGDTAQFIRTATIEQFNAFEFDDLDTTLDTPLVGGSDPGQIHIKRITMSIQNERMFVFGTNRGTYQIVTVQTY